MSHILAQFEGLPDPDEKCWRGRAYNPKTGKWEVVQEHESFWVCKVRTFLYVHDYLGRDDFSMGQGLEFHDPEGNVIATIEPEYSVVEDLSPGCRYCGHNCDCSAVV